MDCQDWTTVTFNKTRGNKNTIKERQPNNEAQRLAAIERKIENNEVIIQKKLDPESKKILIQMRLAQNLNQDKADQLCGLPRNSFRELEAGRRVPTGREISSIQKKLGVALKLV
jgi:hypothetical protein